MKKKIYFKYICSQKKIAIILLYFFIIKSLSLSLSLSLSNIQSSLFFLILIFYSKSSIDKNGKINNNNERISPK